MAKPKKPPAPPAAKAASDFGGDKGLVRDLAEILRATELTEIEVERNGLRVRVARQLQAGPAQPAAVHYAAQPVAPAPVPALPAQNVTAAERAQNPGAVRSPMVGTCYVAPSPGAAPFVKAGDLVKEGQTVLIIEAMKTMNQIPAHKAGRVAEILVRDGQPVEFGEVLIVLE
jgi:acetyl-CoA carboxylase biotin carboxyl carrier protein